MVMTIEGSRSTSWVGTTKEGSGKVGVGVRGGRGVRGVRGVRRVRRVRRVRGVRGVRGAAMPGGYEAGAIGTGMVRVVTRTKTISSAPSVCDDGVRSECDDDDDDLDG